MNTIVIQINKKELKYDGPSCYDECTSIQYQQLHKLRARIRSAPYSRFLILRIVYDMPERYAQYLFDKAAMRILGVGDEDEQDNLTAMGMALLETCNWVFEGALPRKWLIPILDVSRLRLIGPSDQLNEFTFEDFWYAELYYLQRNFTKLMTILYRVKHHKENSRLILNPDKIEQYAQRFGRLASHFEEAIYFNYEGCRQYLAACFPYVFKKNKATDTAPQQGTWLDVAIGMAGDDPIKFNALKKENMYIVLKMLDNNLAQIEKLHATNGIDS